MIFPIESLTGANYEYGLIVAVLIGFVFGFVLERAGFGQATKLAAQFYLYDMTVFKVMFSAIVTGMLGLMIFSGLGLVDLGYVSGLVASNTWVWPLFVGGILLGVGFIVAGYCPGTAVVAASSGSIDGALTVVGVVIGSVVYGEIYPMISGFANSSDLGQVFLYDLLGIPAPVLALLVVFMAMGMFVGAEKLEKIFTAKREEGGEIVTAPSTEKRFAFSALGVLAVLGIIMIPFGGSAPVQAAKEVKTIESADLARRVLDDPWNIRVVDLRGVKACAKVRVPGAECLSADELDDVGLQYDPGFRDLVVISGDGVMELPDQVKAYRGEIFVLKGGFAGWKDYALTAPEAPGDIATDAEYEEFRLRSALHSVMTGAKPTAAEPRKTKGFKAPKKRKGGGCS